MSTIDRSIGFELNDQRHELKFTIKASIMAEKELELKSITKTLLEIQNGGFNVGDTYTLFKWGLLGSKQYKDHEIEEMFTDFLTEYGLIAMQMTIVAAMQKAGVVLDNPKNIEALPQEARVLLTAQPR